MNKISEKPLSISVSQSDEKKCLPPAKNLSIFSIEPNELILGQILTKSRKPVQNNKRAKNRSKFYGNDEERLLEAQLKYSVDDISIIGARQCSDSNRSITNRFMWGLLVFLGLALAIYQIEDRISYYFLYPTSTELDIVPSEENMSFPQITICNDNYIKMNAAVSLGMTDFFKHFLPPYASKVDENSSSRFNFSNVNQTEMIKRRIFLSPGLEDIKKCTWNGDPCPDDLIGTNFTNVGQCLVFNSKKKYFVSRLGQTVGLRLYLKGHQKNYFIQETAAVGYMILVHEQNEPPRMMELGLRLGLGQRYSIAISATRTNRLKAPYGQCTDKPDYHPVNCQRRCITEEIIKNCKCRPIFLEAIGNETICDYFDENGCAENIYSSFSSKSPKYKNSCYCPPLCQEVNYRPSITGSQISEHFVKVQQSDSYEDILKDYAIMRIYFKSLDYTEINTVQSYSSMALLSDIGGALGLLLGSTLLTVVEVLELIVDSFAYVCAKKNCIEKFSK